MRDGGFVVTLPSILWTDASWTMTLLSDAPATSEPGRAETDHVCGNGCAVCDPPAARPAQEAAKATPKLQHDFSDPYCVGPSRRMASKKAQLCSACGRAKNADNIGGRCEPDSSWRQHLEALTFGVVGLATVLRDPKIPERLSRPRLMHSAMWADFAEDAP
jgi:hypothetical protein